MCPSVLAGSRISHLKYLRYLQRKMIFSGCIHKIYNSVQHFVLLIFSACSPILLFSLHLLLFLHHFLHSPRPLLRLLRFLSAIFLCSSARNRAFPDNSPSLGNNWIRVTSTAREAEQEDGGARGRGHFAFEIEKRRIYKRQWLKRGKWPCIVPLAVAAIRLDGSAVRSAGC